MSREHFNPTAHVWLKLVLQAASQTDLKMSSITDSRFIKILNDSTTRHHMKQFITTLKKIHKTSNLGFFFHFITLLQTRSKGGPLLAGEDDTVVLKRNETNLRL